MAVVECSVCGNTTHSVAKGNGWITIILAFFLIAPAIVYEIWRRTGLGCCGFCGSSLVFPSNNKPTQIDNGDFIKQSLGRITFASTAIVLLFFVVLLAFAIPYKSYLSWREKPLVEAFERKHTELVTISRLLLDSDIDLLKTKQRLDLVGDLNSSCLSVASRRLNDALEARVRSERIKAMPFGNDTTRQMMLTVRDYSQHIQAVQSELGRCRYRRY